MICSSCGTTLAQDVHFCPRCGAPVVQAQQPQPGPVYAAVPAGLAYTRVARHLQIAGILWVAYAAERTVGKLIALMFIHGLFGNHFYTKWGGSMGDFGLSTLWPIILVSLVVGLILSLLTGYALLTKQPWGRVVAIVVSVLALFHPVLGTALGIYTLWVLAPAASGVEYAAITSSATSSTPR